jgi:predicted DNA binding CopG/RHH family protein
MKPKRKHDPYKVVLDDEENEIEQALDFKKVKRPKHVKEKIAMLKDAATKHLRKSKQINIRISEYDLLALKEVAADEGHALSNSDR